MPLKGLMLFILMAIFFPSKLNKQWLFSGLCSVYFGMPYLFPQVRIPIRAVDLHLAQISILP